MELDDMLGSMTDAIMRDLKKNTKHKSAPHHVSKREETKSSGSDSKLLNFFVNQITELSLINAYRKSKILIKLQFRLSSRKYTFSGISTQITL